ncbi:MAG: Ig-like domain-containing protein [Eubacterium sp.]|jgi:hypothetical protein|nr:Ig-like domain-containing protein [Eubacterium sp.]
MIRKIISIILTLSLALSFCVIRSSAAAYSTDQTIQDYIKAHLLNFEVEIDVTDYVKRDNLELTDLRDIYTAEVYDDEDLFYVNIACTYGNIGSRTFIYNITYICKQSDLALRKSEMKKAAAKAYSLTNDSMTDAEKILTLHDYMVLATAYNADIDYNENGYGALVKNGATCQGYARGFQYLLTYGGYENRIVRETNESMNHSWNIVKLGNDWYHVDTTKDDPISSKMDYYGRAAHRDCLASDAQIAKGDGRTWNKNAYPKATNTQYDKALWRTTRSPLVKFGDSWYYTDIDSKDKKKSNIYKYDFRTNKQSKVYTFDGVWYVWGTEKTSKKSWPGSYASIAQYNGLLYFNDINSVYSFDPATGKAKKIATKPESAKGYIYGIFINGNRLTYTIKEKLAFKNSLRTIKLTAANSTAVKLNKTSVNGKVGASATIKASLSPAASKDYIYWSSSDTKVATVSKGKISFKAKGEAKVTAYTSTGKQASVTVKVS